jgi:hypothetical protein
MKKTSSKIMAIALTVAILASLIVGILPVNALNFNTPNAAPTSTLLSAVTTYTVNLQTSPFSFLPANSAAPTPVAVSTAVLPGDTWFIVTPGTITLGSTDASFTKNGVTASASGAIGLLANDEINFSIGQNVTAAAGSFTYYSNALSATTGGNVTVQFPAGTTVPPAVQVQVGINSLGAAAATFNVPATVNVSTKEVTAYIITGVLNAVGSAYAGNVQVKVNQIGNPATPGTTYTINAKTSAESTYLTSAAYTIAAAPAPTNISVYNSAGFFLGNQANFGAGLTSLIIAGCTLKLDPGTYDISSVTPYTISAANVTIIPSTGDNTNTIIANSAAPAAGLVLNGTSDTISNIKFASINPASLSPAPPVPSLTLSGNTQTASNIVTAGSVSASGTSDVITVLNSTGSVTLSGSKDSLTNSTIDKSAHTGTGANTLLTVNSNVTSVTGNTFKFNQDPTVGMASATAADKAIVTAGGLTAGLTISNNTFTGNGGWGILDSDASTATIGNTNTFTGCEIAINISSVAAVTVTNNTINNTMTNNASNASTFGAIDISAAGAPAISISGNVISNSAWYSVDLNGVTNTNISVTGNTFTANVKGFNNAGTIGAGLTLNAVQNYWGSSTGPKNTALNPSGTGDIITGAGAIASTMTVSPFLMIAPASGGSGSATYTVAATVSPNFQSTSGVAIFNFPAVVGSVIGTQKLTGNPKTGFDPPYPALPNSYFDVYTSTAALSSFQIRFYAGGLTSAVQAYYWSALSNSWKLCTDAGVDGTASFVYVNVDLPVAGQPVPQPGPTDLQGTTFVLVLGTSPTPAPFAITAPAVGTNQPLTNIAFTWASVPNVTNYEFILSSFSTLASPVVDQKVGLPVFQYSGANLTANTTYFWRVNALQGTTIVGQSAVGYFTAATSTGTGTTTVTSTATAPASTVTVTPTTITTTTFTVPQATSTILPTPTIVITTNPPVTVTFTQPQPTITTINIPAVPAVTQITPAWIWGIIGIGAILIIVVIVLIVRTRRSV